MTTITAPTPPPATSPRPVADAPVTFPATATFHPDPHDTSYARRDGESVVVIQECPPDAYWGAMYHIRFEDGRATAAFEDELTFDTTTN